MSNNDPKCPDDQDNGKSRVQTSFESKTMATDGNQHIDLLVDLVGLAGQASTLSSELYKSPGRCGHSTTSSQLEEVAVELANISTVIYRLNEAMTAQPHRYSEPFMQDLGRNNGELTMYLNEIAECADEMAKADPPANEESFVPWFFKKGRVARLIKHLQLLKGQLSIMRIVLNDGVDIQSDESNCNPRLVIEGRAILEAALAKNQNAVRELLEYENAARAIPRSSTESFSEDPDDNTPGVLHDSDPVFSPTAPMSDEETRTYLKRRFTKRARYGMHIPILNIGNSSTRLKIKWLRQDTVNTDPLTALPNTLEPIRQVTASTAILSPVVTRPHSVASFVENMETEHAQLVANNAASERKPSKGRSKFMQKLSALGSQKESKKEQRMVTASDTGDDQLATTGISTKKPSFLKRLRKDFAKLRKSSSQAPNRS